MRKNSYFQFRRLKHFFCRKKTPIRNSLFNCTKVEMLLLRNMLIYIFILAIIIALITNIMDYHFKKKGPYDRYTDNELVDKNYRMQFVETEIKTGNKHIKKYDLNDLKYFPIPQQVNGKLIDYHYENTWDHERTYGGNRAHEGIDIIDENNERGVIPIVSMSDGYVETKGWLKLGGYRIGIRGTSGAYYYYAHLASYVDNIQVGDSIKAGQILGYMGDTGYSEIEGTTGNFVVHLHVGIYINEKGVNTKSVNPYYILKTLEKNKIYSFN